MVRSIFLVSLAASAVPVVAQPARVSAGTWAIDYARDYCVLSRDGLGGEPGIAFRTRPLADRHDLLVYVPKTGAPNAFMQAQIAGGDGPLAPPRFVQAAELKGGTMRFYKTLISEDEVQAIRRTGSIRIVAGKELDARIALPAIDKAFAAQRACEDELAGRSGLSPADIRGWKTPPKAKGRWSSAALAGGWPDWRKESANNQASFRIDATGVPADCRVLISSQSSKMDTALCKAVMRMRFRPALDAGGKPVRSAQIVGIYWRMLQN